MYFSICEQIVNPCPSFNELQIAIHLGYQSVDIISRPGHIYLQIICIELVHTLTSWQAVYVYAEEEGTQEGIQCWHILRIDFGDQGMAKSDHMLLS